MSILHMFHRRVRITNVHVYRKNAETKQYFISANNLWGNFIHFVFSITLSRLILIIYLVENNFELFSLPLGFIDKKNVKC